MAEKTVWVPAVVEGKRYRSLIVGSPCKPWVRHRGSVFYAHADHDEHRIVLLLAALDRRHRSSWRNRKCCLLCVGRRVGTAHPRRCIARGPGSCFIVNR